MVQEVIFKYQPLLRDGKGNTELAEQGYAIFPLLGKVQINQLKDHYFQFQKENPDHFYSSSHSPDFEFRKQVSNFMKAVVTPFLEPLLVDYRVLGGAFVVKPAGGKGPLEPHQDWNLVDETQGRSYNLWIPLVDVTPENGAVFVLTGSHRKLNAYRGPGIPSVLKGLEKSIWSNLIALNMKAGEALLYDHALIHGSPANKSNVPRLGIVIGVIPSALDMNLCFQNGEKIDTYRCDEDFFLSENPATGPGKLQLLASGASNPQTLDEETFKRLFLDSDKHQFPKSINFFRNLLAKLKR